MTLDFEQFVGKKCRLVVRNKFNDTLAYNGEVLAVDNSLNLLQFRDRFEKIVLVKYEEILRLEQTEGRR